MSTALVAGQRALGKKAPISLFTAARNSGVRRLVTKGLRWAVAKAVGVLSPARKIKVDETTYFICRTDDYISREFVRKGGYHKERLASAIRLLEAHRNDSRGAVLNLGAHVGTTLIPMLQTGFFREGLAVEPAPKNAVLLKKNLETNGLSHHTRIARVAIGERLGKSVLHLSRTNSGNHTLCANKLVWNPFRPKVKVGLTTVDRLLADWGLEPKDVSLVAMDIQGYEEQAISGGRSLFSLSPALILEMDHHYLDGQPRLHSLCQSLESHYQSFYDLDDTSLTRHSISNLETYSGTFSDYRDILFL